jgi:hypothetical protein
MPKTLPLSSSSTQAVDLGDYIHVLDNLRMEQDTMVGRGYISDWRKEGKREVYREQY